MAAITLEDFIKGYFVKDISPKRAGFLTLVMVLVYGVICYALVFVASQLGGVLGASISI